MLVFPCNVCRTSLSADEAQAGQLVRCPTCLSTLRVPASQRAPETVGVGVGSGGGGGGVSSAASSLASTASRGTGALGSSGRATGRRFGFNCGYCSSRLEATESMSAQEGQCPTCGNAIIIP